MRQALHTLTILCAATLLLQSCAREQQLESIQIQPQVQNFGNSNTPVIDNKGSQVQLRALGTYIHPPVTKDITDQVTWSSNTPEMMTVDNTGLLTATGLACGATLISATVNTNSSTGGRSSSGAIVTGYMTGNVFCFSSSGGGSGNPLLSLTFFGSGSGIVVGTNFSCNSPNACSTQAFAVGTPITLTATPNTGSTFGGWAACPVSTTTNVCTFTLTMNTVVTVVFN